MFLSDGIPPLRFQNYLRVCLSSWTPQLACISCQKWMRSVPAKWFRETDATLYNCMTGWSISTFPWWCCSLTACSIMQCYLIHIFPQNNARMLTFNWQWHVPFLCQGFLFKCNFFCAKNKQPSNQLWSVQGSLTQITCLHHFLHLTETAWAFSIWVWPTAIDSQTKVFCTWPQGRAATISSTSTCPAAPRSVDVFLSAAPLKFSWKQQMAFDLLSPSWTNPVTRLFARVLACSWRCWGLHSVRAPSEWADIWSSGRGKGSCGQAEVWVGPPTQHVYTL